MYERYVYSCGACGKEFRSKFLREPNCYFLKVKYRGEKTDEFCICKDCYQRLPLIISLTKSPWWEKLFISFCATLLITGLFLIGFIAGKIFN